MCRRHLSSAFCRQLQISRVLLPAQHIVSGFGRSEKRQLLVYADANGDGHIEYVEPCALAEDASPARRSGFLRCLLGSCVPLLAIYGRYAEFAAIGADIIQTMRLRKEHAAEEEFRNANVEKAARDTLYVSRPPTPPTAT